MNALAERRTAHICGVERLIAYLWVCQFLTPFTICVWRQTYPTRRSFSSAVLGSTLLLPDRERRQDAKRCSPRACRATGNTKLSRRRFSCCTSLQDFSQEPL